VATTPRLRMPAVRAGIFARPRQRALFGPGRGCVLVKPFKARPLIGDIAAQRLWGKGTATQRAIDVLEGTFASNGPSSRIPPSSSGPCAPAAPLSRIPMAGTGESCLGPSGRVLLYIGLTASPRSGSCEGRAEGHQPPHKLGISSTSRSSPQIPERLVIYLSARIRTKTSGRSCSGRSSSWW